MSDRATDHPGDLLSALLDGALTTDDAAAIREHVATCDGCAAELDGVRTARRWVRELPAVDPPARVLAELAAGDDVVPLARHGSSRRLAVAANTVGSVAAGLALLVFSTGGVDAPAIDPAVPVAVERHASTVSALEAGGVIDAGPERFASDSPVPPTTAERRPLDDLPAPYDAPEELAGYRLVDGYHADDGVHLLYQRGPYGLSVFERPGEVAWGSLPAGGTEVSVGGHRAWRWDAPEAEGRLLVVERDGMVLLVVGDEPGDAVMEVAQAMPGARRLPLGTRLKQSIGRALELLAP